jgi:hypothetical protein
VEKTSLDIEKEKEIGGDWNAGNNIGKNFGLGEALSSCFIEWQKPFDCVTWT